MDSDHPYHRMLNLDELQPLLTRRPGHYRGKLLYDSEAAANPDGKGWAGRFEGADFGIEVVAAIR